MKRVQYGVAIWLFFAQAVYAAPPMDAQTQYIKVYWHGFHIGSLIAGWEPTPDGKVMSHAVVQTYGIAHAASRYESDSISLCDGGGVPLRFKTKFSYRKSAREIILDWQDFTLVKEYNQPPEKPGKRTPVSDQMKYQAYDPLTAFFAARSKVMAGEKEFTIPMYDGRRRSDLNFVVLGKRKDGNLEVTMKEIFVAGYTKREQEERAQRDITVHIYVDPKNYIPVGGEGESIVGHATAKLAKTCATFKECLIASKED